MWCELILIVLIVFYLYKNGFTINTKKVAKLLITVFVAILVYKYYQAYKNKKAETVQENFKLLKKAFLTN